MRKTAVWSGAIGIIIASNSSALAQQNLNSSAKPFSIELNSSRSILENDREEYTVVVETPAVVSPAVVPAVSSTGLPEGVELVQQLYPNGSPRIAKHVTLDSKGNYVNHGEYQEWSEKGDLMVSGQYDMGKQKGLWVRYCDANSAKLFASEPYKRFKAPFQSTVEFADGKMNGVWTIADKDNIKISEIQLVAGKRNGRAVWYHPTGNILWQSEYQDGLLSGNFIEKDATGKMTRQIQYLNGQKGEKKTEYHANKKPKQEYQYLTSAQTVVTLDDWNTSSLATYDSAATDHSKAEIIKHGSSISYYENGSVQSQTSFKNGLQDGEFVSWYPNKQKEITGHYSHGRQTGQWSWWHENGMRKATATYENGSLVGTVMAWNDQGIRVHSADFVTTQAEPAPRPAAASKAAVATPKRQATSGGSRSASSTRRPGGK
jgi:antitoxin component YwqK of YwqJK toxin-antitoxin module